MKIRLDFLLVFAGWLLGIAQAFFFLTLWLILPRLIERFF